MRYEYTTENTCSKQINFDLDGNVVSHIEFIGGCNGNLKAISKLVEGMEPDKVVSILRGNTCGIKPTSCADQLARALEKAKKEA